MEMHVITPEQLETERLIEVASCVHPHVTAIHIRQKSWSVQQVEVLAHRLLDKGIPASKLVLNEHALLALEMELGGVHLPEHASLSAYDRKYIETRNSRAFRIGRSVHSMQSGHQAEHEGCNYVFFGHVYATASKPDLPPRGPGALQELCSKLHIPVIAIGGIQPGHVGELHAAGAAGIAIMSGIFEAAQPLSQLELYRKQITDAAMTVAKIQTGGDPK